MNRRKFLRLVGVGMVAPTVPIPSGLFVSQGASTISMQDKILMLDPHVAPLTVLLRRMKYDDSGRAQGHTDRTADQPA